MTPKRQSSFEEKFFARVSEAQGGCWDWHSARRDGYGTMFSPAKGCGTYPHIWSYRFFVGEIPTGLVLDHTCRNRRCVNPTHLDPVTQQENVRRAAQLITECRKGHPYNASNTYVDPRGKRDCRICRNERSNRYKRRKSERVSQIG